MTQQMEPLDPWSCLHFDYMHYTLHARKLNDTNGPMWPFLELPWS